MKSVHVHDTWRFSAHSADEPRWKSAGIVYEMVNNAVAFDGLVGMRGLDDDDIHPGARHSGRDTRQRRPRFQQRGTVTALAVGVEADVRDTNWRRHHSLMRSGVLARGVRLRVMLRKLPTTWDNHRDVRPLRRRHTRRTRTRRPDQ